MADLSALQDALVKADAAGNTDDARALAAEIVRMRGQDTTQPAAAPEGLAPVQKAVLGARGFNDSLAETLGALPDLMSRGLDTVGLGVLTPQKDGATDRSFYTTKLKSGIAALGGPGKEDEKTGLDKFIYGAGHGTGDAAAVFIPATAVANTAKAGSMTAQIAKALAAQPVTQAVSGAMGEGTTEGTGSPVAGLAASLLTAGGMGAGKTLLDQYGARKAMVDAAPTTSALRGQANQAYKAADDAGLVVTGDSFGNAVKNIEDAAVNAGIDKDIHPKASAVLRRLAEEADTPKTLQDLDILRRVAKSAASSIEPDERRIGSIMVDKLDDYVGNLKPTDVAAGDAAAANSALTDARDLWSKMRKSDLIDGIMEKAKTQASGEENGLRIGFRQLLNNKKALRGFSGDEVDAIKQVADGTMTGNLLRKLGKLGFGSGAQSNFLGGSIGAGAGFHVGGPVGAVVVPAAGYVAQKASGASTRSAANYARALAASGPSAAPVNQSLSQALLNPTKGPNAALLAKVLAEQSRYPALNLSQREVQQ